MTPNTDDQIESILPMSDRDHPRRVAKQRIAEYRKPAICNQHASEEPSPTLDVDEVLDRAQHKILGR